MSDTPQFGTAEYQEQPGTDRCRSCDRTITQHYYRVSGAITCPEFGFASPVLNMSEPLQGLLGLVILFVGIRIAWRSTVGTKVPIMGPFKI